MIKFQIQKQLWRVKKLYRSDTPENKQGRSVIIDIKDMLSVYPTPPFPVILRLVVISGLVGPKHHHIIICCVYPLPASPSQSNKLLLKLFQALHDQNERFFSLSVNLMVDM